MSTYWSLYCRDCFVYDGRMEINHGEEALTEAVQAYPLIKPLFERQWLWVELPELMGYGSGAFTFLHDHDGHDVRVRSEYGEFFEGDKACP